MMCSSTLSSPVLYLGTLVFLSPLAFAYGIAFINPSYTFQRAAVLAVTIACTAQLQYSIPVFTGNSTYDGGIMSLVWMFHLRAFDLLLWKAIHLNAATIDNPKRFQIPSRLSRIYTAWCLLFNFRNINTPWVIKGLPTFSNGDPAYVPKKDEFVKRRIAHILITYLLIDALFAFAPPPDPEFDVPESKEPIFSRIEEITLEEIVTRPFTVLVPAFCIYSIFNIPYNIASIIAVLFCGSEPKNWPPLFGHFREAYTLRHFWGSSWHQILRSSLEASSAFLTIRVLCISSQYRILSRFVRLHLAFFIAALVHIPGPVLLGHSPFALGVPKFFLMQAVGIVIESAIFYIWSAIRRPAAEEVPIGTMYKMLGYVWVLAWTTWTGPSFTWLTARRLTPGKDDIVPWSLIKLLRYGATST